MKKQWSRVLALMLSLSMVITCIPANVRAVSPSDMGQEEVMESTAETPQENEEKAQEPSSENPAAGEEAGENEPTATEPEAATEEPAATEPEAWRDLNWSTVRIRITGSGFLYNMVRIIAGTLQNVGAGLWTPERVGEALEARDRTKAGPTAEARGLTLCGIEYF